MAPRFSIVYPTRHRPAFVRQALRILQRQAGPEFEVIVSDNYTDPTQSCEAICQESGLANLTYARPPEPLGMVENWNHALPLASGDYISFLTDKMFVLPGALERVDAAIHASDGPDIVSWTSDFYNPANFADYFGPGTYASVSPRVRSARYQSFSPPDELDRRGRADVARPELSSPDWCRGKLVFGAYRRELLEQVAERFGPVFANINPDYTSMILGLSAATSAIEMGQSCVVSVISDISNGMLAHESDVAAHAYLSSLAGGAEAILPNLPVPGVYASLHNWVAHDYVTLRRQFGLTFELDLANWLVYIHEDIHRPDRRWSSEEVGTEQKRLIREHLLSLTPDLRATVEARIARRAARGPAQPRLRVLRRFVPRALRRRRPAISIEAALDRAADPRLALQARAGREG